MQYVFKFVAESLDAVLGGIQTALGSTGYKLRELSSDSDTFIQSDDSLQRASQSMREGKLASIAIHPEGGLIRYALVSSPLTSGRSLSQYLGTIEYTDRDFWPIWNMLLNVRGLSLVCLGFEEGVEISDEILRPTSFPWNEWPLVIAAIKELPSGNKWTIKEGPEMANVPFTPVNGIHSV